MVSRRSVQDGTCHFRDYDPESGQYGSKLLRGVWRRPFRGSEAVITDLTNRMQSECPWEGEHKSRRDDKSLKAGDEEVDLETRVAVYSCRVEAAVLTSIVSDSEVAELQVDLGTSSAQQLSMDMRRDDDLKIFTTAQEDLDLDENPTVENTQVTDLSEHWQDVSGSGTAASISQCEERRKEQKGTKEGKKGERVRGRRFWERKASRLMRT